MQLYTLHGDGTIRTRRFLNGLPFYGVPFYLWDNETVLTTVSGGRAVGVGVVQGFQQLFVIDPTHVTTMWETTAYSNTWTGLFDFTQGLPVGIDLRDPLRRGTSADALKTLIASTWTRRADRGAEERLKLGERTPLVQIGRLREDPHLEMHTRGG